MANRTKCLCLVPDASFMAKFPGFAEIDETFIPTGLDLIVGPGIEFENGFLISPINAPHHEIATTASPFPDNQSNA